MRPAGTVDMPPQEAVDRYVLVRSVSYVLHPSGIKIGNRTSHAWFLSPETSKAAIKDQKGGAKRRWFDIPTPVRTPSSRCCSTSPSRSVDPQSA